jgi:hypothetical protein
MIALAPSNIVPRSDGYYVQLTGDRRHGVLAFAGNDHRTSVRLKHCEYYDTITNEWSRDLGPLPQVCNNAAVAMDSDSDWVYIFGGYSGGDQLATIQVYYPSSCTWELLDVKLNVARQYAVAIYISRYKGFVVSFFASYSLIIILVD